MTVPPDLARRFRTLVRKCLASKPRGPAPPVAIHSDGTSLSFFTDLGEVSVQLRVAHSTRKQRLTVPLALFQTLEEARHESVELKQLSDSQGVARWNQQGLPVEHTFPVLPPANKRHSSLPANWTVMPPHFVAALHQAGRIAAREPTKFALHRIQLHGKSGSMIATDSKQGLMQTGFSFPFPEDVYLPCVPVFGVKDLQGECRIGRTPNHFVVESGETTFWLLLDSQARFPDVESVIPRTTSLTRIEFGEADASWLLEHTRGFPVTDEGTPITFDVSPEGARLRVRSENSPGIEVHLALTEASGAAVQFVLERRNLDHLLGLGFRSIQIAGAGKPLVARDENRTYLAMLCDPSGVIPGSVDLQQISTRGESPLDRIQPLEKPLMKPEPSPPGEPPEEETLDPLTEAMALKSTLWEAAQRAARLLAAIKSNRKQQRALSQVFSSLKALNLGPRGEP